MGNSAAGRAGNCEVIAEASGGAAAGRFIRRWAGISGGGRGYQAAVRWRASISGGGHGRAREWGERPGGGGCTELRSTA